MQVRLRYIAIRQDGQGRQKSDALTGIGRHRLVLHAVADDRPRRFRRFKMPRGTRYSHLDDPLAVRELPDRVGEPG